MTKCDEVRVKLTNTQLKKQESVAKNKIGATLQTTKKKLRKTFKIKNYHLNHFQQQNKKAFANNVLKDKKLSKSQLTKTVQSGGFPGALSKFFGP